MAQLTIRRLDDAKHEQLKRMARQRNMSTEALAREALEKLAGPTVEEKLAAIARMRAWTKAARIPGAPQTLGVDLIRESRDHDH